MIVQTAVYTQTAKHVNFMIQIAFGAANKEILVAKISVMLDVPTQIIALAIFMEIVVNVLLILIVNGVLQQVEFVKNQRTRAAPLRTTKRLLALVDLTVTVKPALLPMDVNGAILLKLVTQSGLTLLAPLQ
mmetsp:Transcript_25395/g.35605  ORF Transcript_25395/g.35605 Transcript_25395/m.35605 type:complete len:131 (+) Transcript_25395:236-628(+)